jgi:hypothetical protein
LSRNCASSCDQKEVQSSRIIAALAYYDAAKDLPPSATYSSLQL